MALFEAANEFWKSLRIDFVSGEYGRLSPFLSELARRYANGSVLYGHFKARSSFSDNAFPKPLLFQYLLKERLLQHEEIRKPFGNCRVVPEIDLTKALREVAPFDLPGCLATILQNGGAYSTSSTSMDDFHMGLAAALELTDGNLHNGLIWFSEAAWADFFMDVAWDKTIIVYTPRTDDLKIILATDTD